MFAIGSLFVFLNRRDDDCVGMHVHRLGNAQPVRVGLRHGRGRTDWERSPGYGERCDSPRVAQISLELMSASVFLVVVLLIFAKFA